MPGFATNSDLLRDLTLHKAFGGEHPAFQEPGVASDPKACPVCGGPSNKDEGWRCSPDCAPPPPPGELICCPFCQLDLPADHDCDGVW